MSEFERILDANNPRYFRTIYSAINWCAGTDYPIWQKACWPNYHPKDGYRMWFVQLAPRKDVPAIREFVNMISDDGNFFTFDDLGRKHTSLKREDNYWGYDLLFAKEVDGLYTFRGVFVLDKEKTEPNHIVCRRIATKARVYGGPPSRSIELLDEVNAQGYVRNSNVPAKPKGRVRKANGSLMLKCAQCGRIFEPADKCPYCGQLVR